MVVVFLSQLRTLCLHHKYYWHQFTSWNYLVSIIYKSIIAGSFYAPPHSTDTLLNDLLSSIATVKQMFPHVQIILGGDFNCPGIDWEHGTLTDSYVPCYFREKLISLSQDTQLFQMVTFPTRAQNILDLCFTTLVEMLAFLHQISLAPFRQAIPGALS